MEWSVPWSALGLSPGTAFSFHVSSTNSSNIPSQIDDNMGGCGGGAASTQYADLTFIPDQTLKVLPPTSPYAAHTLTNTGNGSDTFELTSTGGSYTVNYYRDADSSGTFTTGDTLLTDTDGDGLPDTGPITSGSEIDLLIAFAIPASGAERQRRNHRHFKLRLSLQRNGDRHH